MARLAAFGLALAGAFLVADTGVSTSKPGVPDPRTCDRNAGDAVLCVSHEAPRAGRIFTGAYLWITRPARTRVTKLTCDAKLGGRIARDERAGATYFDGGVRLAPILRRYWTEPDASGIRRIARATCSWRIPSTGWGKLLSLLQPPENVGDEDATWGLHVEFNGASRQCNLSTWRVGLRGLVTPAHRFRRVAC
jgi:hypothetical protein